MPEEKQACSLPPEYCPHIKEAADEAVKKVFAILGVDVDVPKEVEQFRENLRFSANMRGLLTRVCWQSSALLPSAPWPHCGPALSVP